MRSSNTSNKIIDLSKKKGGSRNAVPNGFSYFCVNWLNGGREEGYAVMVEDDFSFEQDFGLDVISGMEVRPQLGAKRRIENIFCAAVGLLR